MTIEERDNLRELLFAIESLRREAAGAYLPFEVCAAIERAEAARSKCYPLAYPLHNAE